jgi:hypothetical protein
LPPQRLIPALVDPNVSMSRRLASDLLYGCVFVVVGLLSLEMLSKKLLLLS